MDEDVKELTKLLADKIKPDAESKFSVGWSSIIAVLSTIIGFLLIGYITNAVNISRLQSELKSQQENVLSIKQSQIRIENLVTEIRMEQVRRINNEKVPREKDNR